MPYADPDVQREYQRVRVARIRAEWLADKCCVKCGSKDKLHVDHIDPRTKVSHRIWSWSAPRRAEELAKCQVLCKDCHKEKSIEELRTHPAHGTQKRYAHWTEPCRCEACTEAHRAAVEAWRKTG